MVITQPCPGCNAGQGRFKPQAETVQAVNGQEPLFVTAQ
jgi:hypothetical protein